MIGEDFYATIKFKSGEEIFCKVAPCEEEDRTLLLISLPVIVEEVNIRNNVYGYKVEPWLKTTTEDIIFVDLENVLTMSESFDIDMINVYENYVSQVTGSSSYHVKPDKKMGYIASVSEAKKILERIYNNKSVKDL